MSHRTHLSSIDDRRIRWVGIPVFGLLIPQFTGLFGPIGWADWRYWVGYVWFVLISWSIWQGNRWLLFKQRENVTWFEHPVQKLILLVAANVFYTAPVTVGMIWLWFQFSGQPVVWEIIQLVTLANVICVIFVTHGYETVFLIKERQSDLLAFEQLERARVEAELAALKSQIDPHFMFNSLNTLAYLIVHDRERATRFNDSLSDVYRYILMNRERQLVSLREELAFAQNYFLLMQIRFGEGVRLEVDIPETCLSALLPPISLQLLLENAVKHNAFGPENPLNIRLSGTTAELRVLNNLQKKKSLTSAQVGLKNLGERYRLLTGWEIRVQESADAFQVVLPLVSI